MEIDRKQAILLESDENLLLFYVNEKDKFALDVLFERHMASAYHLARKYMRNQADAEDAVQKAFINVMRFSGDQNQRGKVKAWIMQIVVNTCKNEIKHLVRDRKHVLEKTKEPMKNSHTNSLDAEELQKILMSTLERLPDHFRIPIWLTHYENMSVKEISDTLGKPEKTIRTQIMRGLEKLQKLLGNQNSLFYGMNIAVLFMECKKSEKIPPTLAEKVRAINQMNISPKISISQKISPQIAKQKVLYANIKFLVFSILIVGILGVAWQKFSKNNSEILQVNQRSDTETSEKKHDFSRSLNLFTDFNNASLPNWCSIIVGDAKFDIEDKEYGNVLKVARYDNFILKIKIPDNEKHFKVSYDLRIMKGSDEGFRIRSFFSNFDDQVGYFFNFLSASPGQWFRIEMEVEDNVCLTWVDKKLISVFVKIKNINNEYNLHISDMVAKIDNLKIVSSEISERKDFSSLVDMSKEYKMTKYAEQVLIPSPIPNISNENASVLWSNK